MRAYHAITWDHPRGLNALSAAAGLLGANDGLSISWEAHSLEQFESHSIADLCQKYDLVVFDHPHVGEAIQNQCLLPLEAVFPQEFMEYLQAKVIGPCFSSYFYAGKHWGIPVDAAAQVMVVRPDLLADEAPATWEQVLSLSKRTAAVALPLSGPHALLSFMSIAAAAGEPPATADPAEFITPATGAKVWDLMRDLVSRSPAGSLGQNPIGILNHMKHHEDVILCPLVYGYVNYSVPATGNALRFINAPCFAQVGRPGSTLGGTGIGISARCEWSSELEKHLVWLVSAEAQNRFIPCHDGQPSLRSAWSDPAINARTGNFFSNTALTLETAYVRPRHAGYIGFQNRGSAMLRESFTGSDTAATVIGKLQSLYTASRA
ncbi:MAG: extracellular solute-binding protein [Xanthomonadales bacterium]|nr:extracellular solute-binding protein [Xanthomonadales bacterium]